MLPESENRREKFMVQINQKRRAKKLKEVREKHAEFKFNQTREFISEALNYAKQQDLEVLELMAKEFIQNHEKLDIDLLIEQTLSQKDPQTLSMFIPILHSAFLASQKTPIPSKLQEIFIKCQSTFGYPWGKASLLLLNTLLKKWEMSFEIFMNSEGVLQNLIRLNQKNQLKKDVWVIFDTLVSQIRSNFVASKSIMPVKEIILKLLKIQLLTKTGTAITLITKIFQQVDDQELLLNFIEDNLKTLKVLADVLKQSGPQYFQRKMSVSLLIYHIFYEGDFKIALLQDDFSQYIDLMISSKQDQLKVCGFECLESIFASEIEVTIKYVKQYQLLEKFYQLFEQTFKKEEVTDEFVEGSILKAATSLVGNSYLNNELPIQKFVLNCGSRLDRDGLLPRTLDFLEAAYLESRHWRILESRGVVKKIEHILSEQQKENRISDVAERILEEYEVFKDCEK